jgi:hypothetical protein
MFVDHVQCLHNQIQTVLKICSIKKKIYIYKFTILSLSNGRIIVDVTVHVFIYSQVVINTRPYWYTQPAGTKRRLQVGILHVANFADWNFARWNSAG